MKLRLLPSCVSKLCKNYFANGSSKNSVPAIKKCSIEACENMSSTPASQTRRTRTILGTKSVNELLLLIGNTKTELEPAEITASCQKLSEHVFQVLKFQPWAVNNERILWHQSKINTGADQLFCEVLLSSEFALLLQEVQKHIGTFTSMELLITTKSLLQLHVPAEDGIVSALLNTCVGRHRDFSLSELATFSVIGNRLYRNGIPVLCQTAQTLQELAAEKPLCNNLDDFRNFSTILSNIAYVSSESFLLQLLPSFKEIFDKYPFCELTAYSECIFQCMGAFKMLQAKPGEHARFIKKLVEYYVDSVDALSLSEIGSACRFINKSATMSISISELFQKKAADFLHHKWLSPMDVIGIILIVDNTVHNQTLITETVPALENVLLDFDVTLLKHLANGRFLFKINSYHVRTKFSQCVMARLRDVTNEKPCLESILRLFALLHYRNNAFHVQMIEHLVPQLEFDQMGLMPAHVAYVFNYIISCGMFSHLPMHLKEILRQKVHQLSFGDVHKLVHQIKNRKLVNDTASSMELQELASEMTKSVFRRRNEVNSLAALNFLMKTISKRHTGASDFTELYNKHAHTVDNSSLKNACRTLRHHRLLAPQALQCFADFVISAMDCQNLELLSFYLETCAFFNFCPANISDLEQILTKKLTRQYTEHGIHVSTVLSIVESLATLEVFPKDLLNLVFSLEFLKRFDAVCQGASSLKRQHYEYQLFSLNRCLCLECPHFNTPWFHDSSGKDPSDISDSQKTIILHQVVLEQQLEEVLGGPQYFKANQLSPYFYKLDFECLLTKCGLPIAKQHWNKLSQVQRIAILLLSPEDFCRNVPQVLGPVAMKLRHLEIMGYRVVQVPVPYDKRRSSALLITLGKSVDSKQFLSESLLNYKEKN